MSSTIGVRLDDGLREKIERRSREGNFLNLSDYLRHVIREKVEG